MQYIGAAYTPAVSAAANLIMHFKLGFVPLFLLTDLHALWGVQAPPVLYSPGLAGRAQYISLLFFLICSFSAFGI